MTEESTYVSVQVGTARVLIDAPATSALSTSSDEPFSQDEVLVSASGLPNLDTALDGLVATAEAAFRKIEQLKWTKAVVELGVEFALESGTLVAVLGKASGKSALTVQLEFERDSD